ncbi:urease accessory protein UreD [Corynebacterium sp.]|uniref:urease accessory protein UreD n=1 Tax=Corynebacterium sp. TaxID=1720 RepID=UPI0025C10B0F|nr:urease accessory protein UreD [Corynebacterium sp.]
MSSARLDPVALTPPVPWEFASFLGDAATDGVQPVGRPGKVGVLDLTLGVDAASEMQKTGVTSRYVKAPMQFTRPLYVDPADLGEAFVYVRSTGGGLAQNDRIRQRITLGDGARATVTTPAGTPVHRMNAGLATQWISLTGGEDAVCEYLPGQNTLFAGARLLQVTDVSLAHSATLLAADVILTGRLARGERDLFDALGQCWRVERGGRPLLSDSLCVVGAGAGRSEMLLSRWPVWGTVLIVPPAGAAGPTGSTGSAGVSVKELLASVRNLLVERCAASSPDDLTAAASTMVNDAGITVRVAGEDPVAVRATVDAVHDQARRALLGRPAVDLRRM